MLIRTGTIDDLEIIHKLEAECFPKSEAATENEFKKRLECYPNHFWLLLNDNNELISFIDGFTTDESDLFDEMYENPKLHDENGDWQMIFGLNTKPKYQHNGYASILLKHVIEESKNRKGIVLTCEDNLIGFYEKFGFVDEGISEKSKHGDVEWNQMRLTF